jgi:argininosuccinate lyase
MLSNIEVKDDLLKDEKYKYLFSVEEVNKLVLQGIPFRDAYKIIGQSIEKGEFTYSDQLHHTHEGSMGNLCNEEIQSLMNTEIQSFQFDVVNKKLEKLIQ